MKKNIVNASNYSMTDCGRYGKAMETADTGKHCKPAGKVDAWHFGKRMEWKTGAGELGNAGDSLLAGVQLVAFVPVVEDGVALEKQEGFVLTREGFLQALEEAGAIREKTSTAGVRKVTIQTFWNRKQGKPHGSLYFRILDAMYSNCLMTLEEWAENGKKVEG
jgi:hypothetical protein